MPAMPWGILRFPSLPCPLMGWVGMGLIVWGACETAPAMLEAYAPSPDFEEQESTLICWNPQHKDVLVPLIGHIAEEEHLTLFYNHSHHQPQDIAAQLFGTPARLSNILLVPFKLERDNIWIRDYGPNFLHDSQGRLQVVGFEYPHEEFADYRHFSEQVSKRMKLPFFRSKLATTGGGREINGRGTMILIEGYEREINPRLSRDEIEGFYRAQFGQRHFIWLKRGIPQDDFPAYGPIMDNIYGTGANWHVDEFCRFADARTILLAEVDSVDRARHPFYERVHERLEENFQILSQATDQDGQPFVIKRIPQAPVIFAAGQQAGKRVTYTPVTSYLNFVITNRKVILPAYARSDSPDYVREKDRAAMEALQAAFPTRKVVAIDATELNYKGGGLHCITLGRPKATNKRRMG